MMATSYNYCEAGHPVFTGGVFSNSYSMPQQASWLHKADLAGRLGVLKEAVQHMLCNSGVVALCTPHPCIP